MVVVSVAAGLAWRLSLLLALSLLAGVILGGVVWWLLAAAAVALAYMLYNIRALEDWLRTGKRRSAASGTGVWAPFYSDILQLKQRARRRKKRFHRLLREVRESTDAMHDGGVILNADDEIVWMNEAAARLLGLDPSRDCGQIVTNLVRDPAFAACIAAGVTREPVKIAGPGPGRDSHLSLQLIPYGSGQNLLIVQDVSRQVRLEQMRRDFVANASHELRTPLTVVAGYLESLDDDPAIPPGWAAPVGEMRRQVRRMNAIVADLMQLSRLESAETPPGDAVVDVPRMLTAMHRELLDRDRRPATITLDAEPELRLHGEEQELHSIFTNLLNNAVRFTGEDGTVRCRWERDTDGAWFIVEDTGIGIPDEAIPRITERFFRVDGGRAREVGGTGLGLAIVKHALHRHDGELFVESEVGKGSTFRCHFPTARVVRAAGPIRLDT